MKIIVVGDGTSTNLGDPILTCSTTYIVKDIVKDMGDVTVAEFDLIERKMSAPAAAASAAADVEHQNKTSAFRTRWQGAIANARAMIKWLAGGKKRFNGRLAEITAGQEKVCFVIAGGALISRSFSYALPLHRIVSYAKRHGYKVIFNSVGVEKSVRFGLAKCIVRRYINSPSVVAFAARDGAEDVSRLTKRQDFCRQIADPGLFSSEAYGVKGDPESEIVGIGLISLQAYHSVALSDARAREICAEDLFRFWHGITCELDKQGIKWRLFTNGAAPDNSMARTFLKRYGYPEDALLPPPACPEQLVKQIASFRAVAAHRLHSLIITASLGIPIVPVVWSDKVRSFAEFIRISSDLIVWPSEKSAVTAAKALGDSSFTADTERIRELKTEAYEHLKKALMEICN